MGDALEARAAQRVGRKAVTVWLGRSSSSVSFERWSLEFLVMCQRAKRRKLLVQGQLSLIVVPQHAGGEHAACCVTCSKTEAAHACCCASHLDEGAPQILSAFVFRRRELRGGTFESRQRRLDQLSQLQNSSHGLLAGATGCFSPIRGLRAGSLDFRCFLFVDCS